MNIRLPTPPAKSGRFLINLVSQLTKLFRKIRPASGWADKEAPLTAGKIPPSGAPTWSTFIDGINAYKFSATATNSIQISFHLPHDLKMSMTEADGTVTPAKLYPHFHFSSDGTDTGVVRFGVEYTYARGYSVDEFPASTTIYIEQAASGTALTHQIAETTDANAIADANFEIDGIIMMRVFRDGSHANDTCTDGIFIVTVDCHYLSTGYLSVERNRGTGTVPWHNQNVLE